MTFEKIEEASAYIKSIYPHDIKVAMTLGTGLSSVKDDIELIKKIAYSDIPHFPQSTVQGHEGQLIIGKWFGVTVLVLSGRFHCYEGYSAKEVSFYVRVIKALGIENLWISNVAGGLNENYNAGDLILIKDHINLMPDHPLTGANDDRLGLRFPDMKHAYSPFWIQEFEKVASSNNLPFHKGVYVGLQGPSLETPAEYNMLHVIGGDVVGMSTVPEVIVARHANINTMVCSIVSNVCYPPERITETTVEEVISVAHESGNKLKIIWAQMIKNISVDGE